MEYTKPQISSRVSHAPLKNALVIIACLLFLVGCSQSAKPLDSGTASSGMVWKQSLRAGVSENSATQIPQDAKVHVFESVIIIQLTDGSRQIVSLDYVSDLKIK